MKYKITFIIVAAIAMISFILYIAYNKENSSYKSFSKDGYILTNTLSGSSNASTKYYFESDVKYKNVYPESISFSDVDGEKVIADNNSILHYLDGSISVLKKSVIINLDDLNGDILKYYNVFEGTILENNDGTYVVNNAGKQIKFTNFILKVSETKFLIVSKNISLKLSDEKTTNVSGYLEMNILDGDITKLENQEVSYQTVSSTSSLSIGSNIKLDLSNNKVYLSDEEKFNLYQLVIDSDDNIQIVPEEETETDNGDNGNNNNNNGGIDVGGDDNETETEDNKSLPMFSVVNLDVTSNKIETSVKINDEDGLLTGNVYTKIIETNTGKTVYSKEDSTGSYSIEVLVENLSPNVSYTLIMNSDYLLDGVLYNRDFLTKVFITQNLGLSLEKNYLTNTSVSYNLMIESYSKVKNAEVSLLDVKGNVLKKIEANIETYRVDGKIEVLFDSLSANTSYTLKVSNFLYDGAIISTGFEMTVDCKTLKNKPTFGDTSFVIDKKNGLFSLKVNNVSDVDNGVTKYKYEVYDARTLVNGESTPISVIEKNALGSVDLSVDELSVFRGVPYTFKLITEFYDNEKYIEYESEYSDVFKMDGVKFPTIRFEPNIVTFERIEGNIFITDEGNTIPLDNNVMTIVYTNSTGNTNSFTTSGNLSIPLSISGLRANETYTISLYATVNLQDGNPAIDNCFVGSVVVKTNETQELLATHTIDDGSITTAFSVETQLGAELGIDNLLEASTLTGITFNLYSGQTTGGTLVKSVKKVDRNLQNYVSDLKENYYDKVFLITPDFFGANNSDMQEEYYTIEITGAYDYTDYKNNIPIKNSTITVKSNGFIPDLPDDTEKSLDVSVIRNKDAADKYRSDLNPDTIVGYRVRAGYDNSRQYAKYIKYYIHKASNGQIINGEGTTIEIGEDGVINYIDFYLDDGTVYSTNDTDFRRGNEYYFSYEAYLDLNFDGTAETKYPQENVVLRSEIVTPVKQAPIFKTYASTSDSNTLALKYSFQDIDNALVSNKLYPKIGTTSKTTVNILPTSIGVYNTAILTELSKGYLTVETEQALIKTSSNITRDKLIYQYYDGIFSMPTLSFDVSLEVNRLLISLENYDANLQYINRIAALKITFSADGSNIVKDNVVLDEGIAIIDLADIETFVNKDVTVSIEAYYDTGITGFESSGTSFALQTILVDGVGGEYLTINSDNNLRGDTLANGSMYNKTFVPNLLNLTNLITSRTKNLGVINDKSGIVYNFEYLLLKKIDKVSLVGNGSQTFKFNTIIPGVSLLDETGKFDAAITLRDAEINIDFYGSGASSVEGNKFYVELYQTDETGTVSNFLREIEVNIAGIRNTVFINNLNPKTQYFIKLFANVWNGTAFERTQLYDIDFKNTTKIYYFSTLSVVGMANVRAKYVPYNYNTKYINVQYTLSHIVGFDKIKYEIYRYEPDAEGVMQKVLLNIDIPDDTIFTNDMLKQIPCNPGSVFTFGNSYHIVITPIAYATINGEQREIILDDKAEYDFSLPTLRSPFVGIIATATDDLGLEFKISISDIHKVIVNGTYKIKVLDDTLQDVTPEEYKNVSYSIGTLNNTIILSNLEISKVYTLIVTTYVDMQNNTVDVKRVDTSYSKSTLGYSGIDIGDLYTAMNSTTKSKIDLLFYNSYKLTDITSLRYSVYTFSGYAQDNEIEFTPTLINTGTDTFYTFTLPEILPAEGIYYIELQFLYNGEIAYEASIEHTYVEN